jgi:hypothetical protein
MTVPTPAQIHNHSQAVAAAKGTLQATLATNPSAAVARTAHITYYTAVLASARTNGHSTGAMNAILSRGGDVSGQNGDT